MWVFQVRDLSLLCLLQNPRVKMSTQEVLNQWFLMNESRNTCNRGENLSFKDPQWFLWWRPLVLHPDLFESLLPVLSVHPPAFEVFPAKGPYLPLPSEYDPGPRPETWKCLGLRNRPGWPQAVIDAGIWKLSSPAFRGDRLGRVPYTSELPGNLAEPGTSEITLSVGFLVFLVLSPRSPTGFSWEHFLNQPLAQESSPQDLILILRIMI